MRVLMLGAFGLATALSPLVTPVLAEDVFFDGEVLTSCSIEGHSDGTLAIDLTSGGTILSSTSPGTSASVTIRATGSNFINVAAPTRTAQAAGYVATSETLQVAYQGNGTLGSVTQPWTSVGTSQAATTLLADTLTLDNRITNTANGFPLGIYQTRTVVTCTPTAEF